MADAPDRGPSRGPLTQAEHFGRVAHSAWTEAQALIAAGDLAGARAHLDRARRIAPDDLNVKLSLAATLFRLGDTAEAATLFGDIAEKLDVREAWMGLAAAHREAGDEAAAAAALGRMLARHAVPADLAVDAFAASVAASVGAPGWCCLRPDGSLLVAASAKGRISVEIDGKPARAGAKVAHDARTVSVTRGTLALLGSPIEAGVIRRTEGFVTTEAGAIVGWAWHPGLPELDPTILVRPADGGLAIMVTARDPSPDELRPLARPRGIHLAGYEWSGLVHVTGTDGRDLVGSPLDPGAERRGAAAVARRIAASIPAAASGPADEPSSVGFEAVPADIVGAPATAPLVPKRAVAVVIPVHNGEALALACLAAVAATVPAGTAVIVVDDASTEPGLVAALDAAATAGQIRLLRHAANRGFPASANAGIRAAMARDGHPDVILLNSDTVTPPGWVEALRAAVHGAPDIGTASPLSNDASILDYPDRYSANPVPTTDALATLAALAAKANPGSVVDVPTTVGFCLYLRRECLEAVGALREDLFAQGYGEENDFCLRARHLGWRSVAVPGAYVAHVGGQSFGAARAQLLARNLHVLERHHPGYRALIAAFEAADPLREARRRLDMLRWRAAGRGRKRAAILVTHDSGGGVERAIRERCATLRAEGMRPIVVRPVRRRFAATADDPVYERDLCVVGDGSAGGFPNLLYRIPDELPVLAQLLRGERPAFVEVHHLLGHRHEITDLARRLDIPIEFRIHDYAAICPRITLVHAERRYCGEPTDTSVCDACVADGGSNLEEELSVAALRARSAADFSAARRVVTPSADVAQRLRRHFPRLAPEVAAHEAERFVPAEAAPPPGPVQVCVLGAIGTEKGYDVLLACARDAAARRLALRFTVVGHTSDDARLLATGRVFVTGPYREEEAVELVRAQRAHLAWLPSIWPETWCFTLGQAWQAGLRVTAFDIGAPAERIRRTGWGRLLPLGLPPAAINNALLAVPTLVGDERAE